jgi:predicted nucleic acid-binding protein
MLDNRTVRIVAQTADFRAGFELTARRDKGYSLTDCISMQTMRSEGIIDALTNDVHFEQEGGIVRPGPQPPPCYAEISL